MFSLLHASLGRPDKAVAAMRSVFERARHPESIDYVFALNTTDFTTSRLVYQAAESKWPQNAIFADFKGSAAAWSAAANESKGEVLIQMQDDLELPDGWDDTLMEAIVAKTANQPATPYFIAVSDGYRRDRLLVTAIMSRSYFEQKGEFLHHGYLSVFSDDEFAYRAYRDEKAGRVVGIDLRQTVTFRHRHHCFDKSVPDDLTYARENSAEAYMHGRKLFWERNPQAVADGIRDWR